MLTVLFPSLPFQREVDPMWAEEYAAARACGYAVALFDAEQPKLYGPLPAQPVLYRGWMLTEPEYRWLAAQCPLLVLYEHYAASHEASGWYAAVGEYTVPSRFVRVADWLREWEAGTTIEPQFVKGLVKSFGADSRVSSLAEARQLVQRQKLDAVTTLFVRDWLPLHPDWPEQRFFVVHDQVFGASSGEPFPDDLRPVIGALQNRRFYTIDLAFTDEGWPIIIEVGDGQVSDVKEWPVAELYDTAIRALAESIRNDTSATGLPETF